MSPREKVGSRIADALCAILERAWMDSAMWPFCPVQKQALADMRAEMVRTCAGIDEDGIARLAGAPPGVLEEFIRNEIEPMFRREIAGRFVS